jgi:DNA-binding PadR family transcriptional regulator
MLAPTRLLVLSVVRLLQPVHGYDVRRELLSWRADEWASVPPGSVYGALKTLERDGWIEAVAQGIESGTGDPATSVPHHIAEMLRLPLARALP